MKKFSLYLCLAFFAIAGLSSCTDDIVSSPLSVDTLPKASISGYVTSEMNLQTAGLETVPQGTKLFVEINYSDLNSSATGKWKDTVTVTADGKYQVSVPANSTGVTVTITPFAFEADQTQAYGAFYKTIKKAYSSNPVSFAIRTGQQISRDIAYTQINLPTFTDKASVSGKVKANLDASIIGLENVPDGTVINFYNSSWKDSVTVQNGTYAIIVPNGQVVNWQSKFKYLKNVWNGTTFSYSTFNYQYTISGTGTFTSNTTTNDLTAGEGVDLTVDPLANVVQVSGTATAELDLTTIGFENVPDGTKLTFFASDNSWGGTALVSGGKYSINIPKNVTVGVSGTFMYNKILTANPTTIAPTTYTISGNINASNSSKYTYNIIAF